MEGQDAFKKKERAHEEEFFERANKKALDKLAAEKQQNDRSRELEIQQASSRDRETLFSRLLKRLFG